MTTRELNITYPFAQTTQNTINPVDVASALIPYFGPPAHGRLETGDTNNSTPPIYLRSNNKFVAQSLEKTFKDLRGLLWTNSVFPVVETNNMKELYHTLILNDYSAVPSAPASPTMFTTTYLKSRGFSQQWMGAGIKVPFLFFKDEAGKALWKLYQDSIPYSFVRSSIYILYQHLVTANEPYLQYIMRDRTGLALLKECMKRKRFYWNKIHREKEWALEKIRDQIASEESDGGLTPTDIMLSHPRVPSFVRHLSENTDNSKVGQYKEIKEGGQNIPQADRQIQQIGKAKFVVQERVGISGSVTWQPLEGLGATGEHYPFPNSFHSNPLNHKADDCQLSIHDGSCDTNHIFSLKDGWRHACIQFNTLIEHQIIKTLSFVDDSGLLGDIRIYGEHSDKKKAFEFAIQTLQGFLRGKMKLGERAENEAFDDFKYNFGHENVETHKSNVDRQGAIVWIKNICIQNIPRDQNVWKFRSENGISMNSQSQSTIPYENVDYLVAKSLSIKSNHVQILQTLAKYFKALTVDRLGAKSHGIEPLSVVDLGFSNPAELDLILSYALNDDETIDMIAVTRSFIYPDDRLDDEDVEGFITTPLRWVNTLEDVEGIKKITIPNPAAAFMETLKKFSDDGLRQFDPANAYLFYFEACFLHIKVVKKIDEVTMINNEILEKMAELGISSGMNILTVKNNMIYTGANIFSVLSNGGSYVRTEGLAQVKQWEDIYSEMHYLDVRKMQGARQVDENALSIARNVAILDVVKDGVKPIENLKEHFRAGVKSVEEFVGFGDCAFFIVPVMLKFTEPIAFTTHQDFQDVSLGRYTTLYDACFTNSFDLKSFIQTQADSGPKELNDRRLNSNMVTLLGPHYIPDGIGKWKFVLGNSVWVESGDGATRQRTGEIIQINLK